MFTISYGVGNSMTKSENDYRTVGEVLADNNVQAGLGFDAAQVDARVNGTIVDSSTRVAAGMRIELIKKAGRKSAGAGEATRMNQDEQLQPIGIACTIVTAVAAHAQAALEPFLTKLNAAEDKIRKEISSAQREAIQGFKPFNEFVEGLISQIVDQSYIDKVGSIALPSEVREELEAIAAKASEGLVKPVEALKAAEKAIASWAKATEADLYMCTCVADQRVVLAKVLSSDPTKAWTFKA